MRLFEIDKFVKIDRKFVLEELVKIYLPVRPDLTMVVIWRTTSL